MAYAGLQHALQIVYMLCPGQRESLTLCAPSAEKKLELLELLRSLISETIRVALPDTMAQDEYTAGTKVLIEGYLAKQGLVVYRWYRYYIRYTGDRLFYFHSPQVRAASQVPSRQHQVTAAAWYRWSRRTRNLVVPSVWWDSSSRLPRSDRCSVGMTLQSAEATSSAPSLEQTTCNGST